MSRVTSPTVAAGQAHPQPAVSLDDKFVEPRSYGELVWKPALAEAGVIPMPKKDPRRRKRFATTRKEGLHLSPVPRIRGSETAQAELSGDEHALDLAGLQDLRREIQ